MQEARARYAVPVTHLTVDLAAGTATVDPDPRALGAEEDVVPVYHAAPYDEALRIRRRGFREAVHPGGLVRVDTEMPPDGADAVVFTVRVPRRLLDDRARDGAGLRLPAALLDEHGPPVELEGGHAE